MFTLSLSLISFHPLSFSLSPSASLFISLSLSSIFFRPLSFSLLILSPSVITLCSLSLTHVSCLAFQIRTVLNIPFITRYNPSPSLSLSFSPLYVFPCLSFYIILIPLLLFTLRVCNLQQDKFHLLYFNFHQVIILLSYVYILHIYL
jgi:hypothetical protein